MIQWDAPNPVFFDFETQSAAELKEVGGRLYAADPSTRILSAVFLVDGVFHVWIPTYHKIKGLPALDHLWPEQLGPRQSIAICVSDRPPPAVLVAAEAGRLFVAHNCFGFDRFIWQEKLAPLGVAVPPFADTLPVARIAGLPGKLDAIAKDLVGTGKDAGHRILMKFIHAVEDETGVTYPCPGPGDLEVILRYNVADVDLLRRAWDAVEQIPVEADVIDAHLAINDRGVQVDAALANKLVLVSGESVRRAADTIAELTGGELNKGNLRSVKQVNEWLDSKGVRILGYATDEKGQRKRTLRKDFVEQAIANPWLMLDEDSPVTAVGDIDPAVFEVLRLRSAALRITGAKGERAVWRSDAKGRARDLLTYWQAHTGRWSSAGIQVHNLPRPKKGIPVEQLIDWHLSEKWANVSPDAAERIRGRVAAKNYELLQTAIDATREKLLSKAKTPADTKYANALTVDDAISSLLRPLFQPAPGYCFGVVDYSKVECCGVAWIAGQENLLHALATGDIYKDMAAKIFGIPAENVTDYQRQVGKVTVLGCGYSMSAEKFRLYCGLQGIDLAAAGTTAEACVEAFRGLYPRIAGEIAGTIEGVPYRTGGVWTKLAKAAMGAVSQGGIHRAGRTAWAFDGSTLICTLPSGRQLRYRNARIEDRIPGYARAIGDDRPKATLLYDGMMGETTLYGGKITENVVQAICRDFLATALVDLDAAGLRPVMHVHDETVCEVPLLVREESLQLQARIMTTVPDWGAGFPLAVEGFACPRYLKGAPDGWPHVKLLAA